jgi:hypothetical protein
VAGLVAVALAMPLAPAVLELLGKVTMAAQAICFLRLEAEAEAARAQ